MDRQQRAIIHIECQQFLNKVSMLTDEEQWEALSQCYSETAVLFRPSDATTGISGRTAILDSFKSRPPRTSCHIISNSLFTIVTPEKVTAKSRIWLMTGAATETFPINADNKIMVGSFIDTLVLVNGEWLIENRKGSIELKYGNG